MLPDEILLTINDQYPCRETQVRSLAALYNRSLPSPRTLVVHGTEATGKSAVTRAVLQASGLSHAIVDCRECITGRHLLEKTIASCLDALDASSATNFDASRYARCENVSALVVQLQTLLEGRETFVLVFDGIDKQREASPMLLAALTRFGETIPNLSLVLVVSTAKPHLLHSPGIPHLHFPPYTRDECLKILSLDPPNIFTADQLQETEFSAEELREDNAWLWKRFTAVVWDSIGKPVARDIISLRSICDKIWPSFVSGIRDGTYGTRDFARLMVAKRGLFQTEDVLHERIIGAQPTAGGGSGSSGRKAISHSLRGMPYYSRYILCAAYLASFNAARQDPIYFMKMHEKKRRRRALGVAGAGRQSKHRRIPRQLLSPSPFPLDRLLAILHAILPEALAQTADVQTQIATLTSLRLLQRAGAGSGDPLEAGGRWRVNFGWEYAQAVGRSVAFEIGEWVSGGAE